jgi:prepilin-type N-terminal cleavage/methylation domain-containing protein
MMRAPLQRRAHARVRVGESGFTLVEVMVVLLIVGILLAVLVPIVSTVVQSSSRVNNTYANVDEQLWLSTNLQRLLRAAVAPAPSYSGSTATQPPVTPFVPGSISPTSMTFYTNTGTPNGPVKVTAACTDTPGNPTLCTATTSTFTVTMTSPKPGSCPFKTGTLANHCSWPSSAAKILLSLPHVRNGVQKASGSSPLPLFVFAFGAAPALGAPLTITTVCATAAGKFPSGCSGTDATTFSASNCQASQTPAHPFAKCPVGEIDEISYDLEINTTTSPAYGGLQAQDATGIFVLSPTSMLYNATVG